MRPLPPAPSRSKAGRSLGVAVLGICLLTCCLAVPQALADDLGFFASRRVLSDADDAFSAGDLDEAARLYTEVVDGTDPGSGRHARALIGAAASELSQNNAKLDVARRHLEAYLASPDAEHKVLARALQKQMDRAGEASSAAPPPAPEPEPVVEPADEGSAESANRIAALEKQLTAARAEIAEKEKVIEELRKIVVEGGG